MTVFNLSPRSVLLPGMHTVDLHLPQSDNFHANATVNYMEKETK